jgi:SAM-dependent methyltransferase
MPEEENNVLYFCERAYDDWLAGVYDGWYPQLWDKYHGAFQAIAEIMKHAIFADVASRGARNIRILDCACGTAANYIAFNLADYDVWGTDGSAKMLDRAFRNCERAQKAEPRLSTSQLVAKPILWTDTDGYRKCFIEKGILFDLVLLNTNSFCHLPSTSQDPAVPRYMQAALSNFRMLLKPGGRLLIDTKKYSAAAPIDGVPMFKEQQYVEPNWITRSEKSDGERDIEGLGRVSFHTRMHYDVDPYLRKCRALIVTTMYGEQTGSQTMLLPYYPLPAQTLEGEMKAVGFEEISLFPAKQAPANWSYDFVVGRKSPMD